MVGFAQSVAVLMVAVSVAAGETDPPRPNPVPVGDILTVPETAGINFRFTPLAPQFSDYWTGAFPQLPDAGRPIPQPPLPIGPSVYPAVGDWVAERMGTGLVTNELFWLGVYNQSEDKWGLYTTPSDSYDQAVYGSAWHNVFQSQLGGSVSGFLPPAWPVSGDVASNFSGWVDLYAPYLSRAFFSDYDGVGESNEPDPYNVTYGFGRFGFLTCPRYLYQ